MVYSVPKKNTVCATLCSEVKLLKGTKPLNSLGISSKNIPVLSLELEAIELDELSLENDTLLEELSLESLEELYS
jgi:hypothetical protein